MKTARPRASRAAALIAGTAVALAPLTAATAATVPPEPRPVAPLVGTGAERAVTGDYIVVLSDAAATSRVQAVSAAAAKAGGRIHHTYGAALKGFAATLPAAALAVVRGSADVEFVEVDQTVSLPDETPQAQPADRPARTAEAQRNATWGLDRIDQHALPLNDRYTYDATGAGVTAYVVDTGIRPTHNQFEGRVAPGYTAIKDGNGTNDCQGHGTHVAGTVGSKKYGVAKGVTLVPVRVLDCEGSGTNKQVIAGVDWVTANAVAPSVANMSLGGGASLALDRAVERSIEAGVQYALAAGNSSDDACSYSPARTAAAVTVGASDEWDWSASFSNYGSCLDIWAPGDYITSTYNESDTSTAALSGTSMASPHVAGVLALMLEAAPDATPAELRADLVRSSSKDQLFVWLGNGPNKLLYSR